MTNTERKAKFLYYGTLDTIYILLLIYFFEKFLKNFEPIYLIMIVAGMCLITFTSIRIYKLFKFGILNN